ncbi:hypothetical protein ACVWWG_007979 [Bradyrhizobium sp. LB7.2]
MGNGNWKFAGAAIRRLRLSSHLDLGASIELDVASSEAVLERLAPGSIHSIEIDRHEVQDVSVDHASLDHEGHWIVCRPVSSESKTRGQTQARVVQCQLDDTVTKFVSRVASAKFLRPLDNTIAPLLTLKTAVSPGTTLLLRPGDSWDVISRRILDCLRARAPAFVGYRKAFTPGPWSMVAHNIEGPASYAISVDGKEWSMASGSGTHLRLQARRGETDLQKALSQFREEARTHFEFGSWVAPIGPCTVEFQGKRWLCIAVCASFEQNSTDKPFVLTITLTSSVQPQPSDAPPLRRLAEFADWSDGHLIKICPGNATKVASPVLKAMCDWQIVGSDSILALLTSPGFVRQTHSAFYAKLRPGDLVVVEFGRDSVPLVLGGPQRRRDSLEQRKEAELTLSAGHLNFRGLAENGEISSDFDISSSGIISTSAKRVDLRGSLNVTGDALTLSGPVTINGTVQVE